jgi:glycosyltransferase involved in cell wall biosynthesis
VLYVGGLSPHKNLPVLIEAYRRLNSEREFSDLRLLLVGDYSGDVFLSAYDKLRATVERIGLVGRIHFTGFVPDEALVDLYNRAELLVLPSIEEGFGLPALEAAACGTPVVASAAGPIPALLGPAAWTFPPHDTGALAEGLRMLLRDPARRHAMGTEGLRRAANLTWDQAAAQVHALFHELAGG